VRVAILGYYGSGNLGDEAVLWAMLQHLQEASGDLDARVVSADPARTEAVHGVKAVRRTDAFAVRRTFRACDVVCSGGGSLFQDVTSWRSPLFYAWLHELVGARPLLVYAQGVGPLRRALSRWVTRRAMDRAARVTVRDPESAETLRQLGVRNPPEVVCDPTLGLVPDRVVAGGQALVACVRAWPGAWQEAVARAVGDVARERGLAVRVLCMHSELDAPVSVEVAQALGAEVLFPRRPQEALDALQEARAVVGMRLHALALAAAAGVPFVGLSYDPKVESLARALDQPCLQVYGLRPGPLAHALRILLDDLSAGARLRGKVDRLRGLARRPARVAVELGRSG
jgi:polysaccharide pyruvyl transferase CsaB